MYKNRNASITFRASDSVALELSLDTNESSEFSLLLLWLLLCDSPVVAMTAAIPRDLAAAFSFLLLPHLWPRRRFFLPGGNKGECRA